jgi:hypothetical protein
MILWASNTSFNGDGFDWRWLAATLGYLAVGTALELTLRVAPRAKIELRKGAGLAAN